MAQERHKCLLPPPAQQSSQPDRTRPCWRKARLRWRARASLTDEGGYPRTASGTRRALGGGVFPPATSSPFHLEVFPSAHPAPPIEPHPHMSTHAELLCACTTCAPTHSSCPGQYRALRYAERSTLRSAARRVTPLSTELSEKRRALRRLPPPCPTPRCQVVCAHTVAVVCGRHPVGPRCEAIRRHLGRVAG